MTRQLDLPLVVLREAPGSAGVVLHKTIIHAGSHYRVEAYGKVEFGGPWSECQGVELRWVAVNGVRVSHPEITLPEAVYSAVIRGIEELEEGGDL